MKIAVVNASSHYECTLKDVAGFFGTVFSIGRSPFARFLQEGKKRIAELPNIILAYLDSILTAHGAKVRVLDVRQLTDLVPADLYLIASSIVDCKFERQVGLEAKKRFKARVGYFGAFAQEIPGFYGEAADFIVDGDVEKIAPSLARGEIPAGMVNTGFMDNLEALPFPNWDQFPVENYSYQTITNQGITLPVLGSRGCAFSCGYCPYKVRSKYRTRSVKNLVEEIGFLKEKYSAFGISFRDPLRLFDEESAEEFAERLEEQGLGIRFSMEARADRLNRKMLDMLHRAGLRSLEIGVETPCTQTLLAYQRKAATRAHQKEVVDHCHRIGIRVIANYMFGLPNDTREGMGETLRYAMELNTFAIQFTVATPYPGTRLYHEVRDRIFDGNWEHFNSWTNVFHHPSMTPEEIHRLREYAYVTYHFRPRYIWRFLKSTLLYRFLHD